MLFYSGTCSKLALVLLIATQVFGAEGSDYDVEIRVETRNRTEATWVCRANYRLVRCQVSWVDTVAETEGPVLALDEASNSSWAREEGAGVDYRYSGRGLADGECGVTLRLNGYKHHTFVGCRVQVADGGWKYKWSYFTPTNLPPIEEVLVERTEMITLPGKQAFLLSRAPVELETCTIGPGNDKGSFVINYLGSESAYPGYSYHGKGLKQGECGFKIDTVREELNGLVLSDLRGYNFTRRWILVPLIVSRPFKELHMTATFIDGLLTATCATTASRPAAHFTWLLGERVIRDDDANDDGARGDDKWAWPWQESTASQTVRRVMEPEDDGQVLWCVAHNPALRRPFRAHILLYYSDPPINDTVSVTVTNDHRQTTTTPKQSTTTAKPTTTTPKPTTTTPKPTSTTPKPTPTTPKQTTTTPKPTTTPAGHSTTTVTADPVPTDGTTVEPALWTPSVTAASSTSVPRTTAAQRQERTTTKKHVDDGGGIFPPLLPPPDPDPVVIPPIGDGGGIDGGDGDGDGGKDKGNDKDKDKDKDDDKDDSEDEEQKRKTTEVTARTPKTTTPHFTTTTRRRTTTRSTTTGGTTSESTTESTSESTSESTTESTTESTSESTSKSTTESTTESTSESTSESTTESTSESTTESTTESTSTTTDSPHSTCCCHVKRCHRLFTDGHVRLMCIKTFTCLKSQICCPQL